MKAFVLSISLLALAVSQALAAPYGASTDCKAGVACPYPPNTPKASYFTSNVNTPNPGAPYDEWYMENGAGTGFGK